MSLEAVGVSPPISGDAASIRVALVGQPNVGKTSIFNRLTGMRQRVGNYPGVTVERKEGTGHLGSQAFTLLDLPGTYSLNALSMDEHISVRVLAGHPDIGPTPDVIVCVVDAGKLERSLLPALQCAALGRPMVLALNFFDEATAGGWTFDLAGLEQELGIPVVPTIAHRSRGIDQLKSAIIKSHQQQLVMRPITWPDSVREAVAMVSAALPHIADDGVRKFHAQRLLFDSLPQTDPHDLAIKDVLAQAHRRILAGGNAPSNAEPVLLFPRIRSLLAGRVVKSAQLSTRWTDRLDSLLIHPFLGLVIFAALMFGIFHSVYSGAAPLMDLIEAGTLRIQEFTAGFLESTPMLQSLVADGIVAGIGSVLIFLPQILILTLLIALLEDCGYLARAAFLIDRALSWSGLSGKSFVPLMSGFACAIPAIMAARTIEDPKSRLTTILITPWMSCSARLPVYVLMIGAFIEPAYGATAAAAVLFAMHLLGPVLGLPAAWILQNKILRSPSPPFVLEIPPYRRPTFRDTYWRIWHRARRFITDAGTVILTMAIIIWALLYFPRPDTVEQETRSRLIEEYRAQGVTEEVLLDNESPYGGIYQAQLASAYVEQSYLGRAGRWIQPVFEPAGFDWKITVGILASFPAREVIIATLGIIYNLGADEDEESPGLRGRLANEVWTTGPRAGEPVFTVPTAVAVMVFFAICMQCGATIAIMTAETNWRWAWGTFAFMTLLAWLAAVFTYQGLSWIL